MEERRFGTDGVLVEILVNRVLMIAFHYPPVAGSSGVLRTLKFSRYLPDHDWEPIVLTVKPGAYRERRPGQLAEIPDGAKVIRCCALDASRHLSIGGRYPFALGCPDNWMVWQYSGVLAGLRAIRRFRPNVIWSTFPIATAHLIGLSLHRRSGLPWIADFRDVMVEGDYPSDIRFRKAFQQIEASTVANSDRVVLTAPGALELYKFRYSEEPGEKWHCIENGYDEENFRSAACLPKKRTDSRVNLLHSGILYPSERDPSEFFLALSQLKKAGIASADRLTITLRATGHDEDHAKLLEYHGIGDIVRLLPGIDHNAALAEMLNADGLLLFQASNCNNQIPAKLYEYFRAQRPILALTDPAGDTAKTMQRAGLSGIADLEDCERIRTALQRFIAAIERNEGQLPDPEFVRQCSRQQQAAQLATLLDGLP